MDWTGLFQWGFGMLGKMFVNLIPPSDASEEHMTRWRHTVAGSVAGLYMLGIVCVIIVAVHIAWICGAFERFGLSGAAMADTVDKKMSSVQSDNDKRESSIEASLMFIEKQEIRNTLKTATHDACIAIEQNNQGALDSANATIDSLSDRYYRLYNHAYDRQPCDTLLIKPHT